MRIHNRRPKWPGMRVYTYMSMYVCICMYHIICVCIHTQRTTIYLSKSWFAIQRPSTSGGSTNVLFSSLAAATMPISSCRRLLRPAQKRNTRNFLDASAFVCLRGVCHVMSSSLFIFKELWPVGA